MGFIWKLDILASKKALNQFSDPNWSGELAKSIREGENPEKIQNVKTKFASELVSDGVLNKTVKSYIDRKE